MHDVSSFVFYQSLHFPLCFQLFIGHDTTWLLTSERKSPRFKAANPSTEARIFRDEGVDEVFAREKDNLATAFAPNKDLRFATGDTLKSLDGSPQILQHHSNRRPPKRAKARDQAEIKQ